MDDLISRQSALNEINHGVPVKGWEDSERVWELVNIFVNRIKQLPPAQPELGTNLAEVGTDCISRQAALDALNHELRCGAVINQCGLEVAYEVIEGLPPTEPKKGENNESD